MFGFSSLRQMARLMGVAGLALTAGLFGAGLQGGVAAHAASTKPSASQARPPGGPPLTGTIKSATASSLTLVQSGSKKTIQVRLTSKTTYVVKGKRVSKAPTMKKGEQVGVMATKASNGTYTAQSIMIGMGVPPAGGPPGGNPPNGAPPGALPPGSTPVNGTITSASTSAVTVKTAQGTKRVTLTSSTQFIVKGKPAASKPALHAGEKVQIMAAKVKGVLQARVVTIAG